MTKKQRPSSASVLPSHTQSQFKDKPIPNDGSFGPGLLTGRLTLRRIILAIGGVLFVYITITTIFGPTPEHLRDGPKAIRKENDPYDLPKDNNGYNRYNRGGQPVPTTITFPKKENPGDVQNPPGQPEQREPEPPNEVKQGSGSELGGSGLDDAGLKNQDTKGDDDTPLGTGDNKNSNGDVGGSIDDEEALDELEAETQAGETPLSIATKARNKLPISYAQLLNANKREFDYAVALLLREADLALKNTDVYSVTNKPQTAPSGDIHDYLSLSKYYWPNEADPSAPYVRRDGYVNPEIETVRDYRLMRTMIREVHIMGMAYHFTGNKVYADKCAMRLKEWFLDEATYMNPNINYGSLQKGKKLGERTGVLDMFPIFRVFDALHYLKQEPTWPKDLIPALQEWFTRYVKWLETSVLARVERAGNNNHGTYFDVQIIGIYMFLDRMDDARAIAKSAIQKRIDIQITGEGRQPEELARKTSWYYSVFNLQALMTLARWGDDLGVDMWHYVGPQGQSIKKAIDFMLPYVFTNGEGWPVKNIKGFPMGDYLKCIQIAWNIYGEEKYLDAIQVLDPLIRKEMEAGKLKTITTYLCDISTLLEANTRGGRGLIWHWCLT
ncbi:hypothetical protein BGX34_008979 [Mortierella sp. NVP85]|nr:hypothetical protein BGX34_008979 [Mortierella sp. NVP85]